MRSNVNITPRQMQFLLAKVQYGYSDKELARHFRVSRVAVKNIFTKLRHRINARNTTHAVYLLWPKLELILAIMSVDNGKEVQE